MFENCSILSYAMDNIPSEVSIAQAKVFKKFGIPLIQKRFEFHEGFGWDWFVKCINEIDKWIVNQKGLIIIVDADCIPLNRECLTEIYLPAIKNGYLIGPAQRTVAPEYHETQDLIYAGPAMLGFSSDTYIKLGKPGLFCTATTDVGGLFTVRAKEVGVPIKLLMPTHCEELKWKLNKDKLEFGLGTTYENCLYHGFEGRHNPKRFLNKCEDVLKEKPPMTITATISTKDRYFTTLPLTLMAIAQQTLPPKKLIVFDDGEQQDLRKECLYGHLFRLLTEKDIEWSVLFGKKKGQVANHQMALEIVDTDFIWRVDDDDYPEPNVLQKLTEAMKDDVGAVGGLVLVPGFNKKADENNFSSKLSDIFTKGSAQWFPFSGGVKEVDHLNNTFLYRKKAASNYHPGLSMIGHREETMFTNQIQKNGFKVLVQPEAITWHLHNDKGGIRSGTFELFQHDEEIFAEYLKKSNQSTTGQKIIVLNNGIGDHLAFRQILPQIRNKNIGKKILIACCYPEVFLEDKDVTLMSISDAEKIGIDLKQYNIYGFMIAENWKKTLINAFEEMYL